MPLNPNNYDHDFLHLTRLEATSMIIRLYVKPEILN